MNGLHIFTVGGLLTFLALAMGIIRLISAIRPWFAWRRHVDVRLAALEAASTDEMRKELLS